MTRNQQKMTLKQRAAYAVVALCVIAAVIVSIFIAAYLFVFLIVLAALLGLVRFLYEKYQTHSKKEHTKHRIIEYHDDNDQ